MSQQAAATEPKTYYSNKAALTISPGGKFKGMKGRYEEIDGVKSRVGEIIIQFVPIGSATPSHGSYTTDDPQEIEYLDWRIANVGDIYGPDKYYETTTPAEIRVAEMQRQLAESNRLIETLRAQGKTPQGDKR